MSAYIINMRVILQVQPDVGPALVKHLDIIHGAYVNIPELPSSITMSGLGLWLLRTLPYLGLGNMLNFSLGVWVLWCPSQITTKMGDI